MNADDLPDTLTITLRKPVEFAGETYAELHLREPSADELVRMATESGIKGSLFSIFVITGIPLGAIGKIGARDLRRASNYLMAFIEGDLPTGKTGSDS
jgi:hypothetical protein